MKTNDLITALSADANKRKLPLPKAWSMAAAVSAILAGAAFLVFAGVRPDIMAAAETVRFLFKFVFTSMLAAGAFVVVLRMSRPGAEVGGAAGWLAVPLVLLACALGLELLAVPADTWTSRWIGSNSLVCLTLIPLIGIGPLGVLIAALRHGAPTRPGMAGAAAGLLAGAIAATFYAAHCTDDSPLFVATWYPLAISMLAGAGLACGRLAARW